MCYDHRSNMVSMDGRNGLNNTESPEGTWHNTQPCTNVINFVHSYELPHLRDHPRLLEYTLWHF